ncbi:hypothetical protein C5S39_01005 [Candidatus Methanophagaceae archaeon]|nr:hypothetical protein C5S39_01005 [Methanophagales archaeon]
MGMLRGGSCLGKKFGTPFRLFYPFQHFIVALTTAAGAPYATAGISILLGIRFMQR